MPITIELTESEVKTLKLYLAHSIIDAEGLVAVGAGNQKSVDNLKSVLKKIGGKPIE